MARKRQPSLPHPAIVTWTDASIRIDEDSPAAGLKESDPDSQTVRTCGWVLKLGRSMVLVACDSGTGTDPSFRTIQRIPKGLVTAISWLDERS